MSLIPCSTFASQPHRANTRVVLAELGSLSVEFTRLAQITKETKYYDAVARITIEFEKWQNNTKMPGLWPQKVDASGCKKEEIISPISPIEHSMQKGAGMSQSLPQSRQLSGQSPDVLVSSPEQDTAVTAGQLKHQVKTADLNDEAEISQVRTTKMGSTKRQLADDEIAVASPSAKPDCVPQGLASPPYSSIETFTLGGQADSVYEYLPKEYMLLGGLERQYQSMYEMSVEATKKYLLFRPMIPEEERDILFAGQVTTSGHLDDETDVKLKAEGTHLTCFVGGMFAVGAKIFERNGDLEIAKKLTDGCVWAYESTTTDIMPEHFITLPCEHRERCPWNKTLYWEALDPYKSTRTSSLPRQAILGDSTTQDTKTVEGDLGLSSTLKLGEETPSVAKVAVLDDDTEPATGIVKRQLDGGENEVSGDLPSGNSNKAPTISKKANSEAGSETDGADLSEEADLEVSTRSKKTVNVTSDDVTEDAESATGTKVEVPEYTPPPIPTQEENAKQRIRDERLPPGIVRVTGPKYILR